MGVRVSFALLEGMGWVELPRCACSARRDTYRALGMMRVCRVLQALSLLVLTPRTRANVNLALLEVFPSTAHNAKFVLREPTRLEVQVFVPTVLLGQARMATQAVVLIVFEEPFQRLETQCARTARRGSIKTNRKAPAVCLVV